MMSRQLPLRGDAAASNYPFPGWLARWSALAIAAASPALAAPSWVANHPPDTPAIIEPISDGVVVNPADVHMETGPFSDPDAGDGQGCSDWEIWRVLPNERVWHADCATGVERIHIHLGDGVFENSHAGASELVPNTDFYLRVRHSDDSGDPGTQWSDWATRDFSTGTATQVFPLELDDAADLPVPRWTVASSGADVVLSPAALAPRLRLESAAGDLLLEIRANDGTTNTVTNPAALAAHVFPRIQIQGGTQGVALPETNLRIVDDDCATHEILLPAVTVPSGSARFYWISAVGATYVGTSSQTVPNFGSLARTLNPPWSPRRAGFRVATFASGLQLPVNIAFVPGAGPNADDPFLYVTELYGKIRVVSRDGTVGDYATNLLDFNPTGSFPGSGEQGLTGIVVDPATGDVFASMLHALSATNHVPKIVRFRSTDGGRTAATQSIVLDMPNETMAESHQISNLSIGPDGKLYVHLGDGFDPNTARNLNSFRGKILRMNLDGTAPSDNPFYNASDGIGPRDYVFAYGVRNPFGGAWRAADGRHYEVENGSSIDRFAQVVAGRDFGWSGGDSAMFLFAIYNWNPAHAPVNIAFVQPETFGGSGFPANFHDHAFVTESGPTYANGPQNLGKRITEYVLDANGNLASGPLAFLEYAGRGRSTACGLAAGPDGLYMTELYADTGAAATDPGARILRVYYDPATDCNGNGTDDACDIASGASADANQNGIPDECDWSAVPFCFGDGTGAPCPCGNTGALGGGCDNAAPGIGGARLFANGEALLGGDTLTLTATGERSSSFTLFWQSDADVGPSSFGDGLGCLGGTLKRLYTHGAVGGVVAAPQGGDPSVSSRSAALGDPIAPGEVRIYHAFYRDPDPSFCPPPLGSTFNTTNALRVRWGN